MCKRKDISKMYLLSVFSELDTKKKKKTWKSLYMGLQNNVTKKKVQFEYL